MEVLNEVIMKVLFLLLILLLTGCSTIQNAIGTAKMAVGDAADAKLVNDIEGICGSNTVNAILKVYTIDEYKKIRKILGCQGKL
tara:strand:+ start:21506 stop:21757 length:252 start_codon:yes stop_codon:yes gene_type:complete